MSCNILVVYYSSTGTTHGLAAAVADGARAAGAEVRLRRAAELAPPEAIAANPAWQEHHAATRHTVAEAAVADLEWADGYAFGTPTRFGSPAAQLKQFLDQAGGMWSKGVLADKPVTTFTSASTRHGGHEATLLSLNNVFYHWGAVLVPPGYTDPAVSQGGGNPYGTSWTSGDGEPPTDAVLAAARHQGRRLAEVACVLARRRTLADAA